MFNTQLKANIYGVGQLITQRKLFSVPEHQRSFSWTSDEVDQFLVDITSAIERESVDYFIGLIVMQGHKNNSWTVLDGQQRLATTTIIYSAIRDWLLKNDLALDAQQLESEFIGVRKLGGSYTSRLRLNSENREVFDKSVVEIVDDETLARWRDETTKGSSNWLLLDVGLFCRRWLKQYSQSQQSIKSAAQKLFRLAGYLETGVNVIGVDVSSETDAFILFESLNDRGLNLSSLDLVKNYVFSFSSDENSAFIETGWAKIAKNIEGKNADDFLKVFWTSRFGLISKLELFERIKETYSDTSAVLSLVSDLAQASDYLNAIADIEHPLWQDFDSETRDLLIQLRILGNKQIRPVILSGLHKLTKDSFRELLWLMVVVVVRFQIIGRGRTGIMERNLARLCSSIWNEKVRTGDEAALNLKELLPDDEAFQSGFGQQTELSGSRLAYVLAQLEVAARQRDNGMSDGPSWLDIIRSCSLFPIAEQLSDETLGILANPTKTIGNYTLLENELSKGLKKGDVLANHPELLRASDLVLTRQLVPDEYLNLMSGFERSAKLSSIAKTIWTVV